MAGRGGGRDGLEDSVKVRGKKGGVRRGRKGVMVCSGGLGEGSGGLKLRLAAV
jgi:hypothetical protein